MFTDAPLEHQTNVSFLSSALPSVSFTRREDLPRESGVYLAISCHNEVLYVGATKNLRQRLLGQHDRLEDLATRGCDRIAYCLCDPQELGDLEQSMITKFHPPLNHPRIHPYNLRDPESVRGFGQRLLQWMTIQGLTQKKFAKMIDVEPQSMNTYVRGRRIPASAELIKIAQQVTPEVFHWMLTGEPPKKHEALQHLMDRLSTEDQDTVLLCARILASHDVGFVRIIRAVMLSAKDSIGTALRMVRAGNAS